MQQIVLGCVWGIFNTRLVSYISGDLLDPKETRDEKRLFGLIGLATSCVAAARLSNDLVCVGMFVPSSVLLGYVGFFGESVEIKPPFLSFIATVGLLPQIPVVVSSLVARGCFSRASFE